MPSMNKGKGNGHRNSTKEHGESERRLTSDKAADGSEGWSIPLPPSTS